MNAQLPSQVSALFTAEQSTVLNAGVVSIELGGGGGHLRLGVVGAGREPEVHFKLYNIEIMKSYITENKHIDLII